MLHIKQIKGTRILSLLVCFTMVFGMSTFIAAPKAEAKSSRAAVVSVVDGSVTVQGGSSSEAYDAYGGMTLYQGDYIATGSSSSIVIKISDSGDELTIGENAEVYISDLVAGKGKKSKFKMWAGSLWAKVKKLGGHDDFEVETPTAVMGVRGTRVVFGVDPGTGDTYTAVLSGTVKVDTLDGNGEPALVAAGEQFTMNTRDEVHNLDANIRTIDVDQLVANTSDKIIEAILANTVEINAENDEFIAEQQAKIENGESTDIVRGDAQSPMTIRDTDTLNRVRDNLNNVVPLLVKAAIAQGKADKDAIARLIQEVNKLIEDSDRTVDPDNAKPLDPNAGVDPEREKQAQAERDAAARRRKEKEDRADWLALQVAKDLEDAVRQANVERQRIEREKDGPGPEPSPTEPAPKPSTGGGSQNPAPIPTPSTNPSTGGGSQDPLPYTPRVNLAAAHNLLTVSIDNWDNRIKGIVLRFEYPGDLLYKTEEDYVDGERLVPTRYFSIFDERNDVTGLEETTAHGHTELKYFGRFTSAPSAASGHVLSLPFFTIEDGSAKRTVTLKEIIIVDQDGTPFTLHVNKTEISVIPKRLGSV